MNKRHISQTNLVNKRRISQLSQRVKIAIIVVAGIMTISGLARSRQRPPQIVMTPPPGMLDLEHWNQINIGDSTGDVIRHIGAPDQFQTSSGNTLLARKVLVYRRPNRHATVTIEDGKVIALTKTGSW